MARLATLLVSADFLVAISKEQDPDQHYTFTVGNPLPADAQVWSFTYLYGDKIGVILESESFAEVAEGEEPPILDSPTFTSHFHEALPPIVASSKY